MNKMKTKYHLCPLCLTDFFIKNIPIHVISSNGITNLNKPLIKNGIALKNKSITCSNKSLFIKRNEVEK